MIDVMKDLKQVSYDLITIGQYLAPSKYHIAVDYYTSSKEFKILDTIARSLGFKDVLSDPLIHSSYHADKQATQLLKETITK